MVPTATRRPMHGRRQDRLFDPAVDRPGPGDERLADAGGERPSGAEGERRPPANHLPAASPPGTRSPSGRLTLERELERIWEGLTATGAAACPLCGAELRREPGTAAGRCGGCGSVLS